MKNFKKAFDTLMLKISNKENFAFTRFSDHYVTGDIKGANIYTKEEQKEFLPNRDSFIERNF